MSNVICTLIEDWRDSSLGKVLTLYFDKNYVDLYTLGSMCMLTMLIIQFMNMGCPSMDSSTSVPDEFHCRLSIPFTKFVFYIYLF